MEQKELIISLIKADLLNSKLVNGLMEIGLDPGNYFLQLSEIIFKLMGFGDNFATDDIFIHYLQLIQKVKHVDVNRYSEHLERLANEIYLELFDMKPTPTQADNNTSGRSLLDEKRNHHYS